MPEIVDTHYFIENEFEPGQWGRWTAGTFDSEEHVRRVLVYISSTRKDCRFRIVKRTVTDEPIEG